MRTPTQHIETLLDTLRYKREEQWTIASQAKIHADAFSSAIYEVEKTLDLLKADNKNG